MVPKSFINCLNYDKTRKFIDNSCTIIDIIECNDKYIETQKGTIIMIIQKKPSETNQEFTIKKIIILYLEIVMKPWNLCRRH